MTKTMTILSLTRGERMDTNTRNMNIEKHHNFHNVEVNLLNVRLKENKYIVSLGVISV